MPTVRRRRTRALVAPRIPQEAVNAYRIAVIGQDTYAGCLRNEACQGNGRQHCTVCAEHLEASRRLRTALGIPPHLPTPLDVDGPEPAEIVGPDLLWWTGWPRAWELRCALEAAADAE